MKKLNNRGFAISAVLYTLLALILILMVIMLALIGSRKTTINRVNDDVISDINTVKSNSNGGDSNSNTHLSISWRKDIFPGNYTMTSTFYSDYRDINLTGNGAIQGPSNIGNGYNVTTGPNNTSYNFKKGFYLSSNGYYLCFKTPDDVKGTIWYVIGGGSGYRNSYVQLRLGSQTGSVLEENTAPANSAASYSYNNMEANTTYCLVRNSRYYTAYIYAIFAYSPGGEEL